MKPEDRFLFLATRQNANERYTEAMQRLAAQCHLGWNSIFWAAEKNGVAPLVFVNVSRQPELANQVPEEVLDRYRQYSLKQAYLKAKRGKILWEALDYFRQKSIQVLLIKGAALDWLVYDQPWYTVSKDVDIILSPKKDGLSTEEILDIGNYFHQRGVEFDFFEHHDMNMNGVLPVDFQRVWQDARVLDYRGQEVRVLSPEDMLISVCVNSCRKRFFYLKSLCDIAETIGKYRDINWVKFARRAIDFECNNIIYSALLVTRKTIGCQFPDEVLKNLAVHPVRSNMIRFAIAFSLRYLSFVTSPLVPSLRIFDRQVDLSLFLTYSTYTFNQTGRKMKEIKQASNQKG